MYIYAPALEATALAVFMVWLWAWGLDDYSCQKFYLRLEIPVSSISQNMVFIDKYVSLQSDALSTVRFRCQCAIITMKFSVIQL
jgi:hypothetical protein